MAERNVLVVINPISGTFEKEGLDSHILSALTRGGIHAEIAWTEGKGHAMRLAMQAVAENRDALIAVGGDGTVNECASGLRNSRVALGIVPMGSGNGLARHLGIPFNVDKALQLIIDGHVKDCDYGSVNGQPFFCTAGLGFDATVSASFANSKHRGSAAYVKSAMQEYMRFQPSEYIFKINGKSITQLAWMVAICNASQYGSNAYIAPQADITDGILDIKVVHVGNVITDTIAAMDLMTGYIDRNPQISTMRARRLEIVRAKPGLMHIDGEPVYQGQTLDIRCHQGCLRVYAPRHTEKFTPVITPLKTSFNIFSDTYLKGQPWRKQGR